MIQDLSNSFNKIRISPKTLFARILLIIAIPTLIAQGISTYMFYSKHWDNMKQYMIYTLAGEISLIADMYKKVNKVDLDKIGAYAFLQYKFKKGAKVRHFDEKLSVELSTLKSNLQYNLPNNDLSVRYNKQTGSIEVDIGLDEGILFFDISKRRIFASSTHIFILWMIGSTCILLALSLLFARNQTRSITRLSVAAEELSKGGSANTFNPQGAIEVKTVGYALLNMKEKIERQVKEKARILAGVSHDLKTPLTRFKLELALMKQNKHTREMKRDIEQMEKTIHDYLEFARGEDLSLINRVNIGNLLQTVIFECKTSKTEIKLISTGEVYTSISENQFKRAIVNFIDNAKKFASYIEIKLIDMQSYFLIEIHDNGPGIEVDEMHSVLEPFYCTQHSKSKNLIGSGLGMSISHDIITRYHGSLTLSKSHMGGLLVTIKLPK